MLELSTRLPAFSLPDVEGKIVSPDDFQDAPALLVIFMCNHCPFVKYIVGPMVDLISQYQKKSVAVIAISSNDIAEYPEDSPELMKQLAQSAQFTFPYLYDETQQVAKDFQAACTPDFFLFDKDRKLVYRGQLDDSRPSNDIPITGDDLTAAIDAVLEGKEVSPDQKPSIGCNIKWRTGNAPPYAP
jgi:peroxiredoxin